jgi:chromosome segregation ATPase
MKPGSFSAFTSLKSMIAAMEESEAQSEARRSLEQAARKTREAAEAASSEAPPRDFVVVSYDGARTGATDLPAEITEAQRLAAEQRKAAEALLLEACMLEKRAAAEATVERAVRECSAVKERAEKAALEEQQARSAASECSQRHAAVWKERKDAEDLTASSRAALDKVKAQIATLEQQLLEAKQTSEKAQAVHQTNAQHLADTREREAEAERVAADAATRVAEHKAARETAEDEVKTASEHVEQLKNDLASEPVEINDVRALAARIAEQASALRSASRPQIAETQQK